MSEAKWERRDRKLRKRRSQDMVVSNRSIKTVIMPTIGKKGETPRGKQQRGKGEERHP